MVKVIFIINNGDHYSGHFKHSLRDGYGTMYYHSHETRDYEIKTGKYIGNWKRDMKEGKGVMYYDDGTKFEGIWSKGMKVSGKLMSSNGVTYQGMFKNDRYAGKGTLTLIDGVVFQGNYFIQIITLCRSF